MTIFFFPNRCLQRHGFLSYFHNFSNPLHRNIHLFSNFIRRWFPAQFLQELSSEGKIAEYCSTTWGVTFPMTEKVKVNGKKRHPLYAELVETPDAHGLAGPITWNFEKFLVLPSGEVHRFRPNIVPDAPEIISVIEANLPS